MVRHNHRGLSRLFCIIILFTLIFLLCKPLLAVPNTDSPLASAQSPKKPLLLGLSLGYPALEAQLEIPVARNRAFLLVAGVNPWNSNYAGLGWETESLGVNLVTAYCYYFDEPKQGFFGGIGCQYQLLKYKVRFTEGLGNNYQTKVLQLGLVGILGYKKNIIQKINIEFCFRGGFNFNTGAAFTDVNLKKHLERSGFNYNFGLVLSCIL